MAQKRDGGASGGASDRALGMGRDIPRRDFLQGVALAGLGAALPGGASAAPQDGAGYYPPLLHGLRGSHPGSFEPAHDLRDGTFWQHAGWPAGGAESYDLVIVGAGLSGLSAAWFWRQKRPHDRILILDNHDDFGGHAKRNEYRFGNRVALMNGGTLEIDSPRPYGPIPAGLLKTLGIAPAAFAEKYSKEDFYEKRGLSNGIFLDRETFGRDALLTGVRSRKWGDVLKDAPLSETVKTAIVAIEEGGGADPWPGVSSAEKKNRLSHMSYADFLTRLRGFDPAVLRFYQQITHDEWGVGIDAISALDGWGFGLPGFGPLKLDPGHAPRMGFTAGGYADGGSEVFHFPDGNASIARLLVRALIPGALPGHSAEDVVLARCDYAALDRAAAATRIRLSSIVVGARNTGQGRQAGVEIAYSRQGKIEKVRARNGILACYNMLIPYLCPELPEKQKEALHYLVKVPLIYTSVAVRNRRAFEKLGVRAVHSPGGYWVSMRLDMVTTMGGYSSATGPDDEQLVWLVRTPANPGGGSERDQHRAGRADMLATSFETFERNIRSQMGRILGPGGFDPARDITGITVNRWPHGYAYEYNPLWDPDWAPGQAPHEIGRKRFGRLAIANSDAGAGAYTDVAIEQAHRAVSELLSA